MKSNASNPGTVLTVEVPGDILSTTVQTLRPQWSERIAQLPAGVEAVLELHLAQTRMIDSAGLNLLVHTIRSLHERGARLRLSSVHDNVRRTLIFTRLHQQVELVSTRQP